MGVRTLTHAVAGSPLALPWGPVLRLPPPRGRSAPNCLESSSKRTHRPSHLPCLSGWPCFYCPSAGHGVSWGSGPRWVPAGGRAEGGSLRMGGPQGGTRARSGSRCTPGCSRLGVLFSQQTLPGQDGTGRTGRTGCTGIGGQAPGTGSCASFSRVRP